jgi:HEAT repeat protein
VSEARDLVQLLRDPGRVLEAMDGLVGGTNATHLRNARVTGETFAALCEGLHDRHPRVRWWCIQLLDHVPDPRAIAAIAPLLDDPVPRVRRNAAHALGCQRCKPEHENCLPGHAITRLQAMADHDPNAKVRSAAAHALAACRR